MPKPLVFISHIVEEQELAILIKDHLIDPHLLGALDVFVSSDSRVNTGGQSWLKNVETALQQARVFLILASPTSVARPWVNIEAGAGWIRQLLAHEQGSAEIFVMPLCHSGQRTSKLPKPWDTLNAVDVSVAGGLQEILNVTARVADLRVPKPNFDDLVKKVKNLEERYSFLDAVTHAVRAILKIFPKLRPLFDGSYPIGKPALVEIDKGAYGAQHHNFQALRDRGLLLTVFSGANMILGGPGAGDFVTIEITATPKYGDAVLGKIALP